MVATSIKDRIETHEIFAYIIRSSTTNIWYWQLGNTQFSVFTELNQLPSQTNFLYIQSMLIPNWKTKTSIRISVTVPHFCCLKFILNTWTLNKYSTLSDIIFTRKTQTKTCQTAKYVIRKIYLYFTHLVETWHLENLVGYEGSVVLLRHRKMK
jgi:hypothetical protein